VEYYSFVRAMRAIDRADVALLILDASQGVTDGDQRVARFAEERGCAMVVLLNKWDLLETEEQREIVVEQCGEKLGFVGYAPVIRTSARTGRGLEKVLDTVDTVYEAYTREITTPKINKLLTTIRETGHTVSKHGASLKLRYGTQTRTSPPGFVFFANHPRLVDENFRRYLENRMREAFDLHGTPITLNFRQKD
jgi:GTP-binding protein